MFSFEYFYVKNYIADHIEWSFNVVIPCSCAIQCLLV